MPGIILQASGAVSHATTLYSVTVGGVDFNASGLASTPMLDIESVEVEEQGPGGVSSMQCRIFDPTATITEPADGFVEFWDDANGWPLFAGFVQSWDSTTTGVGRWVNIDAIGIEVLLDWGVLPRDVVLADTAFDPQKLSAAVQVLAASVAGLGVSLNTTRAASGGSTQANPVGVLGQGTGVSITPLIGQSNVVIEAGTSLREALRILSDGPYYPLQPPQNFAATVDFRRGLRAWSLFSDLFTLNPYDPYPTDYPVLTVPEALGTDQRASAMNFVKDRASEYAGVQVNGATAGASTFVSSGTGRPGPVGFINDTSITTAAEAVEAGRAWLATKVESTRGSCLIDGWLPDAEYRAGGHIIIVNTQAGVDDEFVISAIRKTFIKTRGGVREVWTVSYGALPPSAVRDLRQGR
jgi:hypothetical protein